ncbi:MAG: hypothetical protein KDE27_14995 [Planctomycetes bacterium]|nr:hypothetical protein [Planctomycetota bacterium]
MPAPDTPRSALRLWLLAAAVFAAAAAVFLLLPQRHLHGVDGNSFVVWVEEGDTGSYARHAAYLHLCTAVFRLLEPFGATGNDALLVSSALGTALGLALLVLAFARLMPAHVGSPLWPTLAVALTPSWFYFATTGEIPGVLAAGVGLAWWQFARWLDRPTVLRAAVLGTSCALAGALHALGHLLTPGMLATAALLARLPARRTGRLPQIAAWLSAHAALALLLSLLLAHGAGGQAEDAANVLADYWRTFAPLTAPAVFYREWVVPFLPWSVGALAALANRRSRPLAWAALAMVALYLGPNVVFLGFHAIHEQGAYFVPIAPVAVLATAAFVTRRGFLIAIAAGAIVTVLTVSPGWRHPVPPEYGIGVRELDGEQKIALVTGSREELDGARAAVKGLMAMWLGGVVNGYVSLPQPAPPFAQWFDGWYDGLRALGMTAVLSESARDFFATTDDPQLGPFWREHVPARYEVVPVERAGFRGVILVRR